MDDAQVTSLLLWLGAALAAGAIEVATLDLVFAMFAGGALSASLAAGLGAPVPAQVVVFGIVSALLLFVLRPVLQRRLLRSVPFVPTGSAALIGREAKVLEQVTRGSGQVRLNGETWSARMSPASGVAGMLPGDVVRVEAIDGATAVVVPVPVPPRPAPAVLPEVPPSD